MDLGLIDPCPDASSGASAHLFLTLLNALMASKCQIHSRENYPTDYSPELKDTDEFDFIVVGAGSAGAVAANKLSENRDWKVLLLEAGDYPSPNTEIPKIFLSLQGTKEDWQYTTEPSETHCLAFKNGRCRWPRGKCLGGSHAINGMVYIRGNRKDYDQWAQSGNEGWDYDSVLKSFKEMEDLQAEQLSNSTSYGRGGFLPLNLQQSEEPLKEVLRESANILGYPSLLEEDNLGSLESLQTIKNGVRWSSAKAFLGTVKDRSNLLVALNSIVEKVVIDKSKSATGVVVNVNGRKLTLKAKKEVILSGGAINSPQILMLSGIGPKEHLQQLGIEPIEDLKVGENLQDHPIFLGLFVSLLEQIPANINMIDNIYQYFMHRRGDFSTIGVTNINTFINTRNDSIYSDIEMHHLFHTKDDTFLPLFLENTAIIDQIVHIKKKINQQSPTLYLIPTLLNPKSHGRILLKSKNPQDKPIIYANYFEDPDDIEVMLEGIKFGLKQLETEPFKKLNPQVIDLEIPGCEDFEFKSDDYWRCALRRLTTTIYHPTSTCKMGPKTDSGAVVDSRLRVHGVKNLRVMDASIMPDIVSANTNPASLMIGRKGATMVMEDWGYKHDEL